MEDDNDTSFFSKIEEVFALTRGWSVENELPINWGKLKIMIFFLHGPAPTKMAIGEHAIEVAQQSKILGGIIDRKLTMKPQTDMILEKLNGPAD